jgi:DNA gyrase subunit B
MITALGAGIGDGDQEGAFDIEKVRYHKVIIMTDADVDGSHIRTLLLTFFCRQMLPLVKAGYVYIAQPPLYKITRKKKEQYVADDEDLNKILIDLGSEDARLKIIGSEDEVGSEALREILTLLSKLSRYNDVIARNSGDFEDYLAAGKDGELPEYLVQVREGNDIYVEYFLEESDLRDFAAENRDLHLFGRKEVEVIDAKEVADTSTEAEGSETEEPEAETPPAASTPTERGVTRRGRLIEIHEAKPIQKVLARLSELGLPIEHFSSQDKPLFEVLESDSENAKSHPVFSVPEILETVTEIGKRGMQLQRFKGLGEMNAKELYTTTMEKENRKLLRVKMDDDNMVEADKMFTILMGDVVEPRRQFIEDNALSVRNLDV